MKKRVVAIMLSLTMCLSMAAEASAASEADFTAETAAADVSEVAVFDDTADEGSSDDAVVVEPDDTGADDVQIDMGSDEDTSTDDAKETNEQESEVDAFSSEDEAVDMQIYGLDETTGSEDSSDQIAAEWLDGQEAAVKENRWIEENGKWKLEKPVAKPVVVQSEESAEAPAAENASDDEVLVASEENQDIIVFDDGLSRDAKYIFCMDPLDGSSNIDVNVSIGTIFSVYRRKSPLGEVANIDDFLQQGCDQVAAGYVIYGSSTMLVYTAGNGVNGFTLDPSIGEFCLSHPNIKTPENGFIYSINEGNYEKFPVGVKKYIKYCQETDKKTKRPYTSRYIGSLVADFHRNLLKGGIFIYPETNSHPTGKLRLLYECNPIAFIAEQAGGLATDGGNRILDMTPENIHQRIPFYTGSKNMVTKVGEFLKFFNNI